MSIGGALQGDGGEGGGKSPLPPFLVKLWSIVDDDAPEKFAHWTSDGEALRIPDPQHFAEACMPRYFKHSKLGTFQQQLQTYGFKRVPNTTVLDKAAVWRHPNFRRNQRAELCHITREPTRKAAADAAPSAPTTPTTTEYGAPIDLMGS
eukprot:3527901-Prymnesium_polylepis.1